MATLTRRELIFRKAPAAAAAVLSISPLGRALAEPLAKTASGELVRSIVSDYRDRYFAVRRADFESFCTRFGFTDDNIMLRYEYAAARLIHDLVRTGGVLGNIYMTVEDRDDEVRMMVRGRPSQLTRKASRRRDPGKMIGDMFSAKPRYRLRNGEKIHCFGDCDEYEMAYITLLRDVGIQGRVVMTSANHVKSFVRIGGGEFLVDNSRSQFARERDCEDCVDFVTGAKGYRNPKRAERYLEWVNDSATADRVVEIGRMGAGRVGRRIENFLARKERRLSEVQGLEK